jgi:hypothetical protein
MGLWFSVPYHRVSEPSTFPHRGGVATKLLSFDIHRGEGVAGVKKEARKAPAPQRTQAWQISDELNNEPVTTYSIEPLNELQEIANSHP